MAVNYSNIDSQTLGNFLQIVFTDGIRVQISEDFRDWEMVTRLKSSESSPRELRFMLQSDFGPAAIQWKNPGSGGTFPASQQVTTTEYAAKFHELFGTIELEHNLYERAMKTPEKYAMPLAIEIQSKQTACKRILSGDFHLDGTGSRGKILTVTLQNTVELLVVFDATFGVVGGERYFEWGDLIEFWSGDGATKHAATGTADLFYVADRDRAANSVTFIAASSETAISAAGTVVAGDYAYRGDTTSLGITKPDQATGFAGVEIGTQSPTMAGLTSLAATDGRLMHGITMSGATKGTEVNAGTNVIDIADIQATLDKVKTIVGGSTYRYPQMLMSPEANASLIESNETDRRLVSITDSKRGTKGFGYVHQNDTLEVVVSEYTDAKRVWFLPQGGKDSGVLELHGTDFQEVSIDGQTTFLRPSAGGLTHDGFIRKYMFGMNTLICKQPNAIASLVNFSV